MTYSLIISRIMSRNKPQVNNARTISAKCGSKWRVTKVTTLVDGTYDTDTDKYVHSYKLYFAKNGSGTKNIDREWTEVVEKCKQFCQAPRWQDNPWIITSIEPQPLSTDQIIMPDQQANEVDSGSVRTQFGLPSKLLGFSEVKEKCLPLIDEMLQSESKLYEVFNGIFDREPQIRTVLSSVKSFLASDRQRRNHVLLYGLPACAKTQILLRFCEFVGEGAVIKIDATNTTQAGIAKLFFDELDDDEIPPFVVIEEIEKSHEDILRIWLGILDERGEIRKMNFNQNRFKRINVLGLSTANDKGIFDKLMGGNVHRPGALSSRFVNQIFCPRPDDKVIRMILERDINKHGGNLSWIEPALKLSKELNTNDPRKILALLDGGDRLLTGDYQADILSVVETELDEAHADPTRINAEELNAIITTKMAG